MCILIHMKHSTHQRINITLPDQTLKNIDQVAKHGSRSHFIDTAVSFYLLHQKRSLLRQELEEGALVHFDRDREIAAELFEIPDSWDRN